MAANRQKRTVRAPHLATQSQPLETLPQISRARTDRLYEDLADAAAGVGARVGRLADVAARKAGEEEGRLAGLDPEFRPIGGIGIYSQNFDAAATEVYARNLETEVRGAMAEAFDANPADPAALNESFEAIRAGFDGSVFDAVRPGFETTFANLVTAYSRDATRNQRKQLMAQQSAAVEADLATRIRGLEQQAFSLGLDGTADAQLAGEMARLRLSLNSVGLDGRPVVTPEAAQKVLRETEVGVARARLLGAFSRLESVAAKEQMLEEFRSDFGKSTGLAGVFDLPAFERITRDMAADIARTARTKNANVRKLGKEVDAFERMAADGFAPPDAELAALRGRVATLGDDALIEDFAQAERRLAFQRAAQTATPAALDQWLARERQRLEGGADSESLDRLDAGEKLLRNMRTGLSRDPLGWAERTGTVPVAPLDFESAAALSGSLVARGASAEQIADYYGIAPRYFRPEERAALAERLGQDPEFAAGFSGAVVEALGEDAAIAFAEISKEAPVLATAGALFASGSGEAARDAAQGAALAHTEGFTALKPGKADAGPLAEEVYGSLFAALPQTLGQVRSTADAIYETRARRQGIQQFDPDLYREALEAATGQREIDGTVYGGVTDWRGRQVWVPPDVARDGFTDLVGSITDADLDASPPLDARGRRLTAADISDGWLVSVGAGQYLVALGDPQGADPQYIAGDGPGGLFVLDLDRLREPLRRRRPELFVGGGA